MSQSITRLAPSPTGALHLGNARTFLVNWLMARKSGWRIMLRIEDIDGPRIKPGAADGLIHDLQWLGLDWDNGPVYQSDRKSFYDSALEQLRAAGKTYPCVCSRKEVEAAASAPHAEDGSTAYPGTCRGRFADAGAATLSAGRAPAIRFAVDDKERVEFVDRYSGPHSFDVAKQSGDFVIAKADGTPAYQLAVVVDDAAMNVTDVVRGDDLLDSTPRQILLYRALGIADKVPNYFHLPLVVGTDGRRLAKRHGDTRLASYRAAGVSAGRVVALLARWCGLQGVGAEVQPCDLIDSFDLKMIPRKPITFNASVGI